MQFSGDKTIEVSPDTYILDAAEVRENAIMCSCNLICVSEYRDWMRDEKLYFSSPSDPF